MQQGQSSCTLCKPCCYTRLSNLWFYSQTNYICVFLMMCVCVCAFGTMCSGSEKKERRKKTRWQVRKQLIWAMELCCSVDLYSGLGAKFQFSPSWPVKAGQSWAAKWPTMHPFTEELVLCTSTASWFLQPGRLRLILSVQQTFCRASSTVEEFPPSLKKAGIKTLGFGSDQHTLAFQSFVPKQMAQATSIAGPPATPPHICTVGQGWKHMVWVRAGLPQRTDGCYCGHNCN